jgi:hypothetical protein
MSENTEKVSPSRKVIIFVALAIILVLLPAGTWFVMKGGLNWRKQAVAELGSYGKIRPAYLVYPDGQKEDRLKGKVTVVHIFGDNPDLTDVNRGIMDIGQRLYDKFGHDDYFRIAFIKDGGTAEFRSYAQKIPSSDYATWVWTGGLGSWRTVVENGYEYFLLKEKTKPDPQYFALTDTSGTIRRFYNAQDEKQVGRMVEHISMLLPKH